MSNEKVFPKGFMFKAPVNAPDWVLTKLSIKVSDAIEFLKENENESGWVNIDVLKSKVGGHYSELNTFKPTKDYTPATKKEDAKNAAEILHGGKLPDYNVFGEEPTNSDDDLPF
jgi:hypothetical protein